ncbi:MULTISPECIES: ABC transporter permease [Pseudothermotoga]|uniref:Monosaccharide-transporting ATPase n=1 Tax=Pseudothermotoga lettingae (strain ATCC BAA-301 / DSM 14385 / NBRC 107922 / TMO) TaxID=416591 RepID=A8F6V1_PSELT|nr:MULTISPECIES: ribose ABC transporter permease [Pseudothermotoga]ABV33885.1 Monosaccharide-transporting ATPase [Pseudothermotoga lettingae TMO]MDK2884284.1 ribose transport system permease protein [Pseudothermotoga sp.]GLI49178.1 ribose ABC transporter permease [Pseudothermotoga lettingae TMO]
MTKNSEHEINNQIAEMTSRTKHRLGLNYIARYQSVIILFGLFILFSFLSNRFLTVGNLWTILRQTSVNLCIAVGMTYVILAGGIDLSVGSTLGFAGAVTARLLKYGFTMSTFGVVLQFGVVGASVIGILAGLIVGFLNGFIITFFNVPAFVATLGTMTAVRGFVMLWTKGYPITKLGNTFNMIGSGWFLGIPTPVWIAALITFIGSIFLRASRFGRYVYAVGGNEKAAILSGVNSKATKLVTYMISGTLAALAGLIITSRLDSAQPNAGLQYELDAIAATVIGGASLSGGKGTIEGTLIGALIIGVLNNGLVLTGVSPFWQQVAKGFIIIAAVVAERIGKRGD